MKLIDLDGDSWDRKPISSKIKANDRIGSYITIGWLYEAPQFDILAHDKEVKASVIEDIICDIDYYLNLGSQEYDYTVLEDIKKNAEKLKE